MCRVGWRLGRAGAGIVQQGRGRVCADRIIPAVLSAGGAVLCQLSRLVVAAIQCFDLWKDHSPCFG